MRFAAIIADKGFSLLLTVDGAKSRAQIFGRNGQFFSIDFPVMDHYVVTLASLKLLTIR